MSKHDENYNSRMADIMKWLLPIFAFAIAGILIAGFSLGWFKTKDVHTMSEVEQSEQAGVVDGDGNFMEAGKVYPMPTAMAFSSEKLAAAIASGNSVDVKISATVTPMDAANQAVDFSVAWGAAPTNGTNTVTDYVTVTPDSDGSTKATVGTVAIRRPVPSPLSGRRAICRSPAPPSRRRAIRGAVRILKSARETPTPSLSIFPTFSALSARKVFPQK